MELEEEISAIEAKLATGASDQSLFDKYSDLKHRLADAEEEWAEACEALESMK